MIIKEALTKGINILKENNIDEVSLTAKVYLANVLKIKKEELIIYYDKEIEKDLEEKFFSGIDKISKGYPLQYLTNSKEFMKMDFFVNQNVLIPRADTENLVEEVIKLSKDKKDILDLCTGSGVVAISLVRYGEDLNITGADISEKALEIAKINSEKLLENQNIKFIQSDMFENIEGKFDIIVSNPPYIKKDVIKEYNLKYEPHLALAGGEDGLEFYKTIINEGYKYLKEGRNNCSRNRL